MKKILVVDDHAANRKLLHQLLQINKYQVLEASNGQEAIDVFKIEQPDLILMDINMPVMDGHQSAIHIKQLCGNDYVPIIFITALSSDESLTKTLASGGDDFVGKPFNFDIIQSKISVHLRIRQLTQELIEQNNYLTQEHALIDYFFENALKHSFLDKQFINYYTSPLSAFNGDVLMSQRGPQGGLYLVTGDFTGHGLAASLGTLPLSQIFFKMARKGAKVSAIAREINQQFNSILPVGMFFAANIIQLDPSCSFVSIWTGGLMPGYHFDAKGNEKGLIKSQNLPLGILPESSFNADPMLMCVEKGDQLYFYSDGITEALNTKNEMFGEKRLHKTLSSNNKNRVNILLNTLKDFRGDYEQQDDISIVELTCDIIAPEKNKKNNPIKDQLLPYKCSIVFTSQMMRDLDPVSIIRNLLSQPLLVEHHSTIHTLLCELYTNALEHSILNLDSSMKTNSDNFYHYYELKESALKNLQSACLQVELIVAVQDSKQSLTIIMEDNGQGFSGQFSPSAIDKLHGRGITIIKSLTESLIYSEKGRKVEAVYNLN